MKIVAISGSPRGSKSQTRLLAEKVLASAAEEGAEVELLDLSLIKMELCRACDICHQTAECYHHDEGARVTVKALAADGLVLATPVYLNHVTAQLKALLDRTSHFIHCLRLTEKYLAAVTTSGGGGGAEVQDYLKNYGLSVGAQFVGGVHANVPLDEGDFYAAAQLGKSLVEAIEEKTQYPEQHETIAARKKHFRQLITARRDDWPYEYQYWKDLGWL